MNLKRHSQLLGHVECLWTGSITNWAQEQSITARTKEEIYLQALFHLLSPIGQNLPHWWGTPVFRLSNLTSLTTRETNCMLSSQYDIVFALDCSIGNLVMLETVSQNTLYCTLTDLYLSR